MRSPRRVIAFRSAGQRGDPSGPPWQSHWPGLAGRGGATLPRSPQSLLPLHSGDYKVEQRNAAAPPRSATRRHGPLRHATWWSGWSGPTWRAALARTDPAHFGPPRRGAIPFCTPTFVLFFVPPSMPSPLLQRGESEGAGRDNPESGIEASRITHPQTAESAPHRSVYVLKGTLAAAG